MNKYVASYAGRPQELFRDLAELAEGNTKLQRMWRRNYERYENRGFWRCMCE